MLADVAVETVLLGLKIAFLVLLYLFIWRIVRAAAKDVRLPQESMILSPGHAAAAGLVQQTPRTTGALIVLKSPALPAGSTVEVSAPTRFGRGAENAVQLDSDEFVSSRHAVLEPRPDGVWVEDVGSTNGTFVNGARVTTARLLRVGDVIRIGQTDLRMEP